MTASYAIKVSAAEQALLLEVHVNGRPAAQIGEFTLQDGKLFARASELRELGLTIPKDVGSDVEKLVPLSSLPGFAFRLDLPQQAIYLNVADALLTRTVLRTGSQPLHSGKLESGTGITLDYDLTGSVANGRASAAGRLDLRAFSPWGIASSNFLLYTHSSSNAESSGMTPNSVIRLDTSYTFPTLRPCVASGSATSSRAG